MRIPGLHPLAVHLPRLLRVLRRERGISRRILADEAGVNVSVVVRAEGGADSRASTWDALFLGLGYVLSVEPMETDEEMGDLLSREADRRWERRADGLCAGKRRFY